MHAEDGQHWAGGPNVPDKAGPHNHRFSQPGRGLVGGNSQETSSSYTTYAIQRLDRALGSPCPGRSPQPAKPEQLLERLD